MAELGHLAAWPPGPAVSPPAVVTTYAVVLTGTYTVPALGTWDPMCCSYFLGAVAERPQCTPDIINHYKPL